METGDLYVRIDHRLRDGSCALLVRAYLSEAEPIDFRTSVDISPTLLKSPEIPPATLALIAGHILEHVERLRGSGDLPRQYQSFRILLDIGLLELVGLDWENILSLPALSPSVVITRFRPVSDMRVVQPFDLPLRVLHLPRLVAGDANPTDGTVKYFRYSRLSGMSDVDVIPEVARARCELVHLVVDAFWTDGNESKLTHDTSGAAGDRGFKVSQLNRALSSCGARFLILQCIDRESFTPAINFADRLQHAGGPTTLVLQGATTRYLDNLYMSIVHDEFLFAYVLSQTTPRQGPKTSLFHGIGGDRVLKFRPLADRLIRASGLAEVAGVKLIGDMEAAEPEKTIRFGGVPTERPEATAKKMAAQLKESLRERRQSSQLIYDYSRESGAWIPLALDMRAHARAVDQIESLQRSVDRVVNVGFVDAAHERKLSSRDVLQLNTLYQLSVQIGRRADWSLIDGDAAFPERALEGLYTNDGIELRVVVFATSFVVAEPDRRLRLQRPPAESEELRFELRTPPRHGVHRVRVCIYKDLNLLQSVLIRVAVGLGAAANRLKFGIEAEVEFALSSTLADVQDLPTRTCNFLTNSTDEGTHTMAIVGSGLTHTFDFGDGEMRAAVGAARDALFMIAADASTKPPAYRFDNTDNSTTIDRLEQHLVQLGELGYELYSKIVMGSDRALGDALQKVLGPAGATIQIAAVKSAQYVFPWALVYDHPLVTGALKLCPQYAADASLRKEKPLSAQVCLTQGCPYRSNSKVVCPSGFWGFRHHIEQPLSVDTKPNASGKQDVSLEIDGGPRGGTVSALMVVSRELNQVKEHESELHGSNSFAFQVKDTKLEASECLIDPARAAHLVYFYCHGGRDKARTWLGIGSGREERLVAADLLGLQIDWTDIHPLVFINGCHTADFTPDDLLNFNQALGYCRAAGVIGTEISVPENLARFFAQGFMIQFRNGVKVGAAMREQRLRLLERCNVLGLAYTPYCSMDLRVVYQ